MRRTWKGKKRQKIGMEDSSGNTRKKVLKIENKQNKRKISLRETEEMINGKNKKVKLEITPMLRTPRKTLLAYAYYVHYL